MIRSRVEISVMRKLVTSRYGCICIVLQEFEPLLRLSRHNRQILTDDPRSRVQPADRGRERGRSPGEPRIGHASAAGDRRPPAGPSAGGGPREATEEPPRPVRPAPRRWAGRAPQPGHPRRRGRMVRLTLPESPTDAFGTATGAGVRLSPVRGSRTAPSPWPVAAERRQPGRCDEVRRCRVDT